MVVVFQCCLQLYKRLVPVDMRVKEDLDDLLERLKQGEDVGTVLTEAPGLKDNKQKKGKNEDSERRKKKHKAELDDGAPKKKQKIAGRWVSLSRSVLTTSNVRSVSKLTFSHSASPVAGSPAEILSHTCLWFFSVIKTLCVCVPFVFVCVCVMKT